MRALLVGQFINAVGSFTGFFLTLYLVSDRGLSATAAGAIVAALGAAQIVGGLLGGGFSRGPIWLRRVLALALGVGAAGYAVVPLATTGQLLLLMAGVGLVGGCKRPIYSALIAAAVPPERRREGIAMSRATYNAGAAIGPPLGGLLAAHHFDALFWIQGAAGLVLLGVVLRWVPQVPVVPAHHSAHRSVLHALWADRPTALLLVNVMATDTAYRLLYPTLPLQLRAGSAPPWVYGAMMSLNCVAIVVFEPWMAGRLRHRPAPALIGGGYALVGVGWLTMAVHPGVALAAVAVLVLSAGEMLYNPTATALAADRAPIGMQGRYQSLYGSASIAGTVLSPIAGGALYDAAPGLVWPVGGALALAAAAALWFGWRRLHRLVGLAGVRGRSQALDGATVDG